MPTLVGGVGYAYLRDGSLGPVVIAELQREPWPDGVLVEDLSYGPIAVMQRLQEADPPFERLVLVSAVGRGRPPGTVTVYRWVRAFPDEAEVQARVAEAVTGVISLDNLVIVAGFFDALPEEVFVVEVEPEDEGWGEGFTPAVERVRRQVRETVRALGCDAPDRVPDEDDPAVALRATRVVKTGAE
jgi:hydrogenase maturation protease